MTRDELADEIGRVLEESKCGREDQIRALLIAKARLPGIEVKVPGGRKPLLRPYGGLGAKRKKERRERHGS